MKGDFSRDSFDRLKRFSRVLMQQGRVQLDSDWNEQTSMLLDYIRTLAADIIGPHAGPAEACGFEILTDSTPDLDHALERIESNPERRRALREAVSGGDVVIGPGRYYVHGVLVENDAAMLYTEQPGYLASRESSPEEMRRHEGSLLVYLDVWERHVTSVEDPEIREPALGDADTCTRPTIVWRVRILFQPPAGPALDSNAIDRLEPMGTGRLRARTVGGYRGADNRLYRVEVHRGGTAGSGATFKWSRENGSVAFPIRALAGATATLAHLNHHGRPHLEPGDWVEVMDDDLAMRDEVGTLAQVEAVDRHARTVALAPPSGVTIDREYDEAGARASHALLRRWDHTGDRASAGAVRITEQTRPDAGWMALEDGVEIAFGAGDPAPARYRAGDFWLIPARPATADVEWPKDVSSGRPVPARRTPRGPFHYYAPLLVRDTTGIETDCRRPIPRDAQPRPG